MKRIPKASAVLRLYIPGTDSYTEVTSLVEADCTARKQGLDIVDADTGEVYYTPDEGGWEMCHWADMVEEARKAGR